MERYETGIHLLEAGVISGHDSTPESAVTKLMFLLWETSIVGNTKFKGVMEQLNRL